MLPNNFFPYLKHPHLTNAPHFVSKYTKCRRSSAEPYFLPLFTEVRGIGILRSSDASLVLWSTYTPLTKEYAALVTGERNLA